jgi:hypothetical protein
MKILVFSLIFQILSSSPLLLSSLEANNVKACYTMFRPLENTALKIKGPGGTWQLFEKRKIFRKHAVVGLHVDSKITALIFTINYLCESQEGIPMNEVAGQVVPTMAEKGLEGFIEYYLVLAHELEEIKGWIENARQYFDRYQALATKLKKTNDVEGVSKEGKDLIEDIMQFNAVDPLLKQANSENSKIPQVSNLLNIADEM